MSTETPLLNLTPVYLQNTDNIVNTLIFMNVDQGHDFHDGSARTKTSAGLSTWVDLDLKNKGFLNQIPSRVFYQKYPNDTTPDEKTYPLSNDDIFGNSDFIKGSLNTTFVGGSGAYAFVVVEDEDLKIPLPEGTTLEEAIIKEITKNITIKIQNNGDKFYIYAEGDTQGENGKTFNIGTQESPINIMFLPFYQRVYNGSMHKLWTFNSIKHIYLIKLTKLILIKSKTELKISNEIPDKIFTCEKFTEINSIVPQYVMIFKQFIEGFIKNLRTRLEEKSIPVPEGLITGKKIDYKMFDTLSPEIKEIILELFLNGLFTNNFDAVSVNNIVGQSSNLVEYNSETNKFYIQLEGEQKEFTEFIPRGTKYYFDTCGDKGFRYFLHLLYSNQKPFIHPNYNFGKPKLETARNSIFEKITNELLNKYNDLKKTNTEITESSDSDIKKNFISKQYGYITDTNIGSYGNESTADFLIDSFNNTIFSSQDGGGDLDKLELVRDIGPNLATIKKERNYTKAKGAIKKIIEVIQTLPNCSELSEELKDFVLNKFSQDISDMIRCGGEEKISESVAAPGISSLIPSSESPRTDVESISPVSEGEIKAPVEEVPESSGIVPFNNIDNVNAIFGLDLQPPLTEFVKINSTLARENSQYDVDNYSNDLQMYYDYIPQEQTETEITSNYFNTCWQSTDFYQQGGANYPFKFTIASGSLDSSSLGGQSIPQYHPPEVDIYMPIYNLNGPNSNLKGVIVRMVFVKEILNNPINSKSKVVVFCHFVYVDFDRTRISPPSKDSKGNDVISEYPDKFKALLEYVVKYTVCLKDDSCVNINDLLGEVTNNDLNKPENIDFKLELYGDDESVKTQSVSRNWYKYFTHTQGPTVKESIVIPVNYNTRKEIEAGTAFDYVASGIVDVAEKLIDNSGKLQAIFRDNQTLFLKLFLVRNKYTGDKSRSTDSLFLNQSKYLEGVQISNDENTLYNAQMFGLNTVWSTTAKSVFYMTPYMTKTEKVPITTGAYVDKLNTGLATNPNVKVYVSLKPETGSQQDDATVLKTEIRDEIMDALGSTFVENYISYLIEKKIKTNDLTFSTGFVSKFIDGIFEYRDKLNIEIDEFFRYCDFLDDFMNKCEGNFDDVCIDLFNNRKEKFPSILNKKYKTITETISTINSNLQTNYTSLINFIEKIEKTKSILTLKSNIDGLKRFVDYITKTYPWWLPKVLDYKKSKIDYNYCKTVFMILNKLEKFHKDNIEFKNTKAINPNTDNPLVYYNTLASSIESGKLPVNCSITFDKDGMSASFNEEPPVEPNDYLKEYIPKSPDSEGYNANKELENLQDTELKYKIASSQFFKKLIDKRLTTPINSNNDPALAQQTFTDTDRANKRDELKIAAPKRKEVIQRETVGGKDATTVPRRVSSYISDSPTLLNKKSGTEINLLVNNKQDNSQQKDKNELPEDDEDNLSEKQQPKIDVKVEDNNLFKETFSLGVKNFYRNSYKCNVGNRIKNYIELINNIQTKYGDLVDSPFNIEDDSSVLIIKIFMKNINFINNSFSPAINYTIIIQQFTAVNETYTVEKMNGLLNLYSSQLSMYSLIDSIMEGEYTPIELANLLYDSISDSTLTELDIGYLKYEIERKIMSENPITVEEQPNLESDEEIQNEVGNVEGDTNSTEKKIGGNTKKRKNNKKIIKTRNNKNVNGKKKTIKRRNIKHKKYSRKN
jgi:hypothetical protein